MKKVFTGKDARRGLAPGYGKAGLGSGRGTTGAVSVSIGSGDDYIQKIGRGKRPYYQGDHGTPSQGADSTFSSYLSRVNKGYEEEETPPMFPEQELDDEDTYKSNRRERKMNRKRRALAATMAEISDRVVESSKYSLLNIFDSNETVLETAYDNHPTHHDAKPSGYEFRNVPTVTDEEGNLLDEDDLNTDAFAVAYTTDSGTFTAQARSESLKEAALRRIVRRHLGLIKEEDETLIDDVTHPLPVYEDEDEEDLPSEEDGIEEYSGGSAVAGVVTPLGTGPSGKPSSKSDLKRQRSVSDIYKNYR